MKNFLLKNKIPVSFLGSWLAVHFISMAIVYWRFKPQVDFYWTRWDAGIYDYMFLNAWPELTLGSLLAASIVFGIIMLRSQISWRTQVWPAIIAGALLALLVSNGNFLGEIGELNFIGLIMLFLNFAIYASLYFLPSFLLVQLAKELRRWFK